MRPRTVDVAADRAHLADELRAIARKAHGSWEGVSTSGQADLLTHYRHERARILARLRQLRRVERHRAATDARRRLAAAFAAADAQAESEDAAE
jgi:hypothetical protein